MKKALNKPKIKRLHGIWPHHHICGLMSRLRKYHLAIRQDILLCHNTSVPVRKSPTLLWFSKPKWMQQPENCPQCTLVDNQCSLCFRAPLQEDANTTQLKSGEIFLDYTLGKYSGSMREESVKVDEEIWKIHFSANTSEKSPDGRIRSLRLKNSVLQKIN